MDAISAIPRATKATIATSALYLLLSFFSWQRHSFGAAGTYAQPLWHGLGMLAALLAVAYLGWEIVRLLYPDPDSVPVNPEIVSAAAAGLLLLLNLIIFFDWSEYRAWPAFLGLLLMVGNAGAAFYRAHQAGITLPQLDKLTFGGRSFALAGPNEPVAEGQPVAGVPSPDQL
jgi:hypothetical protein